MRRLSYTVNLESLKKIKDEIVPTLFTEHQFYLIKKKFTNKKMTASEKNEFSRTISRKMNAINLIFAKETDNFFIYGEEKIKPEILESSKRYLKELSRKFKGKHVFISGSYLYSENYNDIDVFVVSKYDKEDQFVDGFHINYLTEDVCNSLFFSSAKKLCVSNRKINSFVIKETVNVGTFISLYQELFNDLDRNFKGVKKTMREFILQSSFISKEPIPDSLELKNQIDSILRIKKPKELVKKIFVKTILLGISPKKAISAMKQIINSYSSIMQEYKKYKNYYTDLMQPFKEVIAIESWRF